MENLNESQFEKQGFSIREVAQAYGVSPSFVRLEIDRGNIKPLRLGRRVILTRNSIQAWIAKAQG